MIFETFDPTYLNHLVNKPENRVELGIDGEDGAIDLTDCATNPLHRIITNGEDAFLILLFVSPAIYELHMVFDKPDGEARRPLRKHLETGRALVEWVWENTSAKMLYGGIPISNRKACAFARLQGFTSDGFEQCSTALGTYTAEWFHRLRPES